MNKTQAILNKFIYNDKTYDTSSFAEVYADKTPSIYEVIRIFDGTPLFLEEHYNRLINSGVLLGNSINVAPGTIKENIMKMIALNGVSNQNIKLVINDLKGDKQNIYYYFIKSDYPRSELYNQGINTFTYKATRNNPNAKVIYQNMRDEINRLLDENKCYEAILVNDRNEVTEGSRSNLFFIKGSIVYTAPPQDVLMGITRERIITLCRLNNIEVIETPIKLSSISDYDACFISGTSPKVLPIMKIDKHNYEVTNELLHKIMDIYDLEIEKYLSKNKKG